VTLSPLLHAGYLRVLRTRFLPALCCCLLLIPLCLQSQPVIRVKISAARQTPELKLVFPRTGFGVGGECIFTVTVMADPGARLTNIAVTENFEYGQTVRALPGIKLLSDGIPGLFLCRVRTEPVNPGVYEYEISVSGMDPDGLPFRRTASRQIIVDDKLDESLTRTMEIGPFVYMSSTLEGGRSLDEAVRRLRLVYAMRLLKRTTYQYKVIVDGYCDSSDRDGRNAELSTERGRAVAAALSRGLGIPAAKFVVTGRGSAAEPYPDPPGTKDPNRNRRVTVRFE
jgi:hypothetical protein